MHTMLCHLTVEDEPAVAASPNEKSEDAVSEPSQEVIKPSEADSSESSDEDSDSEEDDPEKLWCVCRQPHDDR